MTPVYTDAPELLHLLSPWCRLCLSLVSKPPSFGFLFSYLKRGHGLVCKSAMPKMDGLNLNEGDPSIWRGLCRKLGTMLRRKHCEATVLLALDDWSFWDSVPSHSFLKGYVWAS